MPKKEKIDLPLSPEEILSDYRLAYKSRQASIIGRREVLSGKAKFGIFGDGKEVVNLAIAHSFKKGDWRSGYYRDQTWMFALGIMSIGEFFAQLFAHTDVDVVPSSAGRSMNSQFATRFIANDGSWKNQMEMYNISSDVAPTGSQMPRLVGLAFASNLYRNQEGLKEFSQFSDDGNEVAWGSIGNATTAEGMFWEAVNAIGVLGSPAIISVYDDGYGISVPNQFQMVKENISAILSGFQRDPCPAEECDRGYDIYTVRAWDYPAMLEVFMTAADIARAYHIPALVHVTEVTQPQGHSTSGSHERYKTPERLEWEAEHDCLVKMRQWMIEAGIVKEKELASMEVDDKKEVEAIRASAWEAFMSPILAEREDIVGLMKDLAQASQQADDLNEIIDQLKAKASPLRRDIHSGTHQALRVSRQESSPAREALLSWKSDQDELNHDRYSSHLYSESEYSALKVSEIKPIYSDDSPNIQAFEIFNACFDAMLARDPRVVAFGEDVGFLGDVNQGFHGLQEKYGSLRVMDTGIREITILGQAIGLAMRGLRPICEIQYLDYLLYALQLMSDDLATLQWRTKSGQKAPVIMRTRGHRLEGIWHSGSPLAGIINLVRGIYVLVPRNAVQAAGYYNTLLKSDDPGLIIEVLNAYRLRERMPDNIGEICLPLGVPETLRTGTDVTLVTYGAMCRIALDAAEKLDQVGIDLEVIDVQSLLPFDRHGKILESLKKTNRIIFADEDVPGGTSAYMMAEVIEKQGGYYWLDSAPRTIAAKSHRPAYASDGDYFSKPNVEDVFDTVYEMMSEVDPEKYPEFYK
jgi:pyruvate/2-oxoglutarate/acetoin dehydrogenase E1 component/TPP-dependent pyruvate/acetoin dehydrogenase alpha subunit